MYQLSLQSFCSGSSKYNIGEYYHASYMLCVLTCLSVTFLEVVYGVRFGKLVPLVQSAWDACLLHKRWVTSLFTYAKCIHSVLIAVFGAIKMVFRLQLQLCVHAKGGRTGIFEVTLNDTSMDRNKSWNSFRKKGILLDIKLHMNLVEKTQGFSFEISCWS